VKPLGHSRLSSPAPFSRRCPNRLKSRPRRTIGLGSGRVFGFRMPVDAESFGNSNSVGRLVLRRALGDFRDVRQVPQGDVVEGGSAMSE
jgi:hypothetical protein